MLTRSHLRNIERSKALDPWGVNGARDEAKAAVTAASGFRSVSRADLIQQQSNHLQKINR